MPKQNFIDVPIRHDAGQLRKIRHIVEILAPHFQLDPDIAKLVAVEAVSNPIKYSDEQAKIRLKIFHGDCGRIFFQVQNTITEEERNYFNDRIYLETLDRSYVALKKENGRKKPGGLGIKITQELKYGILHFVERKSPDELITLVFYPKYTG